MLVYDPEYEAYLAAKKAAAAEDNRPSSEFDEELADMEERTSSPELRALIQVVRKIANKVDCPPEE